MSTVDMSTPALPRVMIVDDHGLFRSGVRAELGPDPGAKQAVIVDDHDGRDMPVGRVHDRLV